MAAEKTKVGGNMKLNAANLKNLKNCTNVLELVVPPELERTVATGVEWFDQAIGGEGMTPSSAMIFTGTPGAGKTTAMLQVADAITGAGHVCLFNTGEESPLQVRKVVKRLECKNGFYIGQDEKVEKILEHARKIMAEPKNKGKQFFLICDSLQTLDDGKYTNGYTNSMTQVRAIEELTDFAKTKPFPIVIVIGQVTKGGEFAGKQQVKHTVDIHAHLYVDMGKKSETYGYRLFEVQKNRFGCTGITFILNMHKNGLKEVGTIDQFNQQGE